MITSLAFADGLIKRYPDPDAFPYQPWSYPQGYLLMGMAKLYEATGLTRFLAYIRRYCDAHVDAQGRVRGFTGCSMDDMMAGAVLVWMYQQTKAPRLAEACRHIRAAFDGYPRTREGGFWHNRDIWPQEMWVDGVFMGQMFLCRYGAAFDAPDCFLETIRQFDVIYEYCHTHDGLLAHGYSEDCLAAWATETGRAREVWSEGLGWYALILVEALSLIPADTPGRQRVEAYAKELFAGLKMTQDGHTGLWFQVVDKGHLPDNWCDTSGSAMFYYAIASGVRMGLIGEADYAAVLGKAYAGLQGRLTAAADGAYDVHTACDGLCVQNTYDDYIRYPQTVNAKEAVCGMLWALIAHDYR